MNQDSLKHIAIIMDGNRRWEENNNQKVSGHQAGIKNIFHTIMWCLSKKISTLTLFAFSTENNNRSDKEVKFLFSLLDFAIDEYKIFLIENNVHLKFIGNLNIINRSTLKKINSLEIETKVNPTATLNLIIAFNYSGRQDILHATRNLVLSGMKPELVTEATFQEALYSSCVSEPDLLIRTGGQVRLSNFLMWQISYTELHFTQTNWPDFNSKELDSIVEQFYQRKRNFGK